MIGVESDPVSAYLQIVSQWYQCLVFKHLELFSNDTRGCQFCRSPSRRLPLQGFRAPHIHCSTHFLCSRFLTSTFRDNFLVDSHCSSYSRCRLLHFTVSSTFSLPRMSPAQNQHTRRTMAKHHKARVTLVFCLMLNLRSSDLATLIKILKRPVHVLQDKIHTRVHKHQRRQMSLR